MFFDYSMTTLTEKAKNLLLCEDEAFSKREHCNKYSLKKIIEQEKY